MPFRTAAHKDGKEKEQQHPPEHAHEGSGSERAPGREAAAEDFEAAVQRAEEMVDRAADRVTAFAARLWRQCRRVTARTREEVEDMWAEAQTLRRGGASADED